MLRTISYNYARFHSPYYLVVAVVVVILRTGQDRRYIQFHFSAVHTFHQHFLIPDIPSICNRLQWHLLLEPAIPSLSGANNYARAFQLLLERKRLSTWGITSYELHKPSGRIIFPASSSMYQCLDTGYNVSVLFHIRAPIWFIFVIDARYLHPIDRPIRCIRPKLCNCAARSILKCVQRIPN